MPRYYDDEFYSDEYLAHWGVPGMHWGQRQYQNYDGSLTTLGREHYGIGERREARKEEKEYFKNRKSNVVLSYEDQVKRRKKQIAKLRRDHAKQQKAKADEKEKNRLSSQDFDGYAKGTQVNRNRRFSWGSDHKITAADFDENSAFARDKLARKMAGGNRELRKKYTHYSADELRDMQKYASKSQEEIDSDAHSLAKKYGLDNADNYKVFRDGLLDSHSEGAKTANKWVFDKGKSVYNTLLSKAPNRDPSDFDSMPEYKKLSDGEKNALRVYMW